MGGNYGKDVFKQLQETMAIVEKLSAEISNLKKENEELKSGIEHLEKEKVLLKAENQKLKGIINKDSGNSSKPPSSDGFKKIHNSREKTSKKTGGQSGHKGSIPKLFANPTKIVEHKTRKCCCGGHITYTDAFTARQLIDIEFNTNITEHRTYTGVCECCNKRIDNKTPFRDILTYGENLKAFAAMLSAEGMVSINRTKSMLFELSGGIINISEGTLCNWDKDLSKHLAPAIQSIKDNLFVAPVLHKDETGIRVNNKMHWLHVLCTPLHTLYFSHKKRGSEADKAMGILLGFSGILMHDHWRALYTFLCTHAECNAHILRYLKSAIENKKRVWAVDMIELLLRAKNRVSELKLKGKIKMPQSEKLMFHEAYDKILDTGQMEFLRDEKLNYNGDDMKLLRRMKKGKAEHLRYIEDFAVPFDNNLAERDLRMIKAKTKISGCFRGSTGGEVFATIKSYTSTLRKHKLNIFEGLKTAFNNQPLLFNGG